MVALGTRCAKNERIVDLVFRAPKADRQHSHVMSRRLRRLTEVQVRELAEAREAGMEINDLAERFGIDRSTVITHLRRAGVPGRKRQGRSLDPCGLLAAGELYAQGASLVEVGVAFDVDRRYLRKVLPEAGFALRPAGRQPGRGSC